MTAEERRIASQRSSCASVDVEAQNFLMKCLQNQNNELYMSMDESMFNVTKNHLAYRARFETMKRFAWDTFACIDNNTMSWPRKSDMDILLPNFAHDIYTQGLLVSLS